VLINLIKWFVGHATLRRSFQIKTPMNCIVRAEEIPHYDKPNLNEIATKSEQILRHIPSLMLILNEFINCSTHPNLFLNTSCDFYTVQAKELGH
jgi:hypothetical protein